MSLVTLSECSQAMCRGVSLQRSLSRHQRMIQRETDETKACSLCTSQSDAGETPISGLRYWVASGELAQPSKPTELTKGCAKIAAWLLFQPDATLLELLLFGRTLLIRRRFLQLSEWGHGCLVSGRHRRKWVLAESVRAC